MLRAMRAEKSVGSAIASSKLLVCSDCVPPSTAASASIVVRTMLLYASCSVSDTPLVWQCVRSNFDFSFFAPRSVMIRVHKVRAARSFATSMNRFMPMPKKNERRGAKWSMSRPEACAARTYSLPSASVYASSWTAVAPASCM